MNEIMEHIIRKNAIFEFEYFKDSNHPMDSSHRVFKDVGLKLNADVHLFKNGGGEECVGIWVGDDEWGWDSVTRADNLFGYWNEHAYKLFEK